MLFKIISLISLLLMCSCSPIPKDRKLSWQYTEKQPDYMSNNPGKDFIIIPIYSNDGKNIIDILFNTNIKENKSDKRPSFVQE